MSSASGTPVAELVAEERFVPIATSESYRSPLHSGSDHEPHLRHCVSAMASRPGALPAAMTVEEPAWTTSAPSTPKATPDHGPAEPTAYLGPPRKFWRLPPPSQHRHIASLAAERAARAQREAIDLSRGRPRPRRHDSVHTDHGRLDRENSLHGCDDVIIEDYDDIIEDYDDSHRDEPALEMEVLRDAPDMHVPSSPDGNAARLSSRSVSDGPTPLIRIHVRPAPSPTAPSIEWLDRAIQCMTHICNFGSDTDPDVIPTAHVLMACMCNARLVASHAHEIMDPSRPVGFDSWDNELHCTRQAWDSATQQFYSLLPTLPSHTLEPCLGTDLLSFQTQWARMGSYLLFPAR